jgi:hypothetical protein
MALGLSTYTMIRLNSRVRNGIPIFVLHSAPVISAIKPSNSYMQRIFLPTLKSAEQTVRSPKHGSMEQSGFNRSHYRSRIGNGEADYKLVISMMRIWKHVEAADWITLHWAKDSVRDYVAIIFRSFLGYAIAPFRVHESWSNHEEPGERNSTIVSSGACCATSNGHFLQATLTFKAEWERPESGDGGGVFFDIVCDSRPAASGVISACAGNHLTRLHDIALGSMCTKMGELCANARTLRASRQHALK